MKAYRLGSGDDTEDLGAGEWKRNWRFSGWRLEKALETWGLGSGEDTADLVVGE